MNFVLSAAHCFTSLKYSDLLAGIHDFTEDNPDYELQVYPADITSHPNFNKPVTANDIAVVSTKRKPFSFSGLSIQPITLAPSSFASVNFTGYTARVAGW